MFGGGEREEESGAKRGGGVFFFYFWKQRGARVSEEGRRGGAQRGSEGCCGDGGGGAKFFFFGVEMSTRDKRSTKTGLPRKAQKEKARNSKKKETGSSLSFLSLFFLEFLVFSPCEEPLVFLIVFPFFSRDFRGSVGIKNPCFFWWFSLPFSKKNKEKEGQGLSVSGKRFRRFRLPVPVRSLGHAASLRYLRDSPDPRSPQTPQQQKKEIPTTRQPRLSPKVSARSPTFFPKSKR